MSQCVLILVSAVVFVLALESECVEIVRFVPGKVSFLKIMFAERTLCTYLCPLRYATGTVEVLAM